MPVEAAEGEEASITTVPFLLFMRNTSLSDLIALKVICLDSHGAMRATNALFPSNENAKRLLAHKNKAMTSVVIERVFIGRILFCNVWYLILFFLEKITLTVCI